MPLKAGKPCRMRSKPLRNVGGILGALLLAGCSSPPAGPTASATASTASPIPATTNATVGVRYLAEARAAFQSKKYQDAAIRADLAADILPGEKAPTAKRIEAHRIAGQAYYKQKNFPKALQHYKSLRSLDPKNKSYAPIIAALESKVPSAPKGPLVLTPEQQHRREEHRLNKVIPVRVTTQFDPMGRIEHMTVREYERRKKVETIKANPRSLNY